MIRAIIIPALIFVADGLRLGRAPPVAEVATRTESEHAIPVAEEVGWI